MKRETSNSSSMKKLAFILSICLILIISSKLSAQEFDFGFQAGIIRSNTHLILSPEKQDAPRSWHPIVSYNLNGYIGFKSNSFWAISVEPGYIQKGDVLKYEQFDPAIEIKEQLNYLQMPVLWRMYFLKKLFISLGPEFAYMINAKAKTNGDKVDVSKDYDRKFEISGIIGLGFSVIKQIDVEFRYNHGFTHKKTLAQINNHGTIVGEVKEYNEYLQLLARFKF